MYPYIDLNQTLTTSFSVKYTEYFTRSPSTVHQQVSTTRYENKYMTDSTTQFNTELKQISTTPFKGNYIKDFTKSPGAVYFPRYTTDQNIYTTQYNDMMATTAQSNNGLKYMTTTPFSSKNTEDFKLLHTTERNEH